MSFIYITLIFISILVLCFWLWDTPWAERLKFVATITVAFMAILGPLFAYYYSTKHFKQTLLQSKQHFELINRPFIQIELPKLAVIPDLKLSEGEPTLQFAISTRFIPRGNLPSHLAKVECVIQNLDENQERIFMPYDEDKDWNNVDLFSETVLDISMDPLINLKDIQSTMSNHTTSAFYDTLRSVRLEDKVAPVSTATLLETFQEFYLIYQLEFYKLGDENKLEPYFYSVRFKVTPARGKFNIKYYSSKSGKSKADGAWFKIMRDSVTQITPHKP